MSAHAGEDVEQGKQSSIAGVSVNLYSHYGNQYGGSSKSGIDLPQDLPKPLLGIYPKNLSSSYRDTGPPVSTSLLLGQACIITPDFFLM